MRKLLLSLAVASAAALTACATFSGHPTDKAQSYAEALDLVKKNIDLGKFKIYAISFFEREPLSDDLFLVTVKMVNRDDQCFSQTFYTNGLEPTALDAESSMFAAPKFETTKGIDLETINPQTIEAQIAEAKEMLPENFTYKSTARYEIEETVPSGNEFRDRNKNIGEQNTSFLIRFTENGKETESSAGKTSYIYYEGKVTVGPDGTCSAIEEQ